MGRPKKCQDAPSATESRRRSADSLTWKEHFVGRLKTFLLFSLDNGLCIGLAILHDLTWFSSYNILYQDQPSQASLLDYFLKNFMLLVVSQFVLPNEQVISTLAGYSFLLSWLAISQNLPNIDSSGDASKIFMEHVKCSLNLFQKLFIFKTVKSVMRRIA
ncbi:hypothetical protein HELRODRAFT_168472 [Helobdella robusta]|uniref:Uncharacterized protein n=1 Tax=Helobdella robusta TaxID=6412 RepID=T1F0M1_HELRO|nr:hypothetical protein HELRODRAFT_168472 [Helobdella robusta]ESO09484.1 hypothetical protein HELRODRAFT_168472 [Helobdella robusta]